MGAFGLVCWIRKGRPVVVARILIGVLIGLALYALSIFFQPFMNRSSYDWITVLLTLSLTSETLFFFPNPDLVRANPFQRPKTIQILQLICVLQGIWILSGIGLTMLGKAVHAFAPGGRVPNRHRRAVPLSHDISFRLGLGVGSRAYPRFSSRRGGFQSTV